MRLQQLQNSYLYEGLDRTSTNTMLLWESAGLKLREAALSPDQIQQIFAAVEKGATDAGSNRTMLGKGKDAASAVNQAWEDLKTKVQNSGPIKAVDQKFDDVVAKIEAGLGGPDNKVNQVIQKYRKFAKDRPISQGLIYAALIAAAGISGAGLGGAAVLGLLKMTDKLLQGEKFSSAAYSGAKTGAISAVAGQVGQAMRGDADVPQGAAAQDKGEVYNLTGEHPGNPADWAKGNNPPPDWVKDPSTGKYFDPNTATTAAADTSKAAASAADSSASSISDKNAKYAWQMVQQKVDSGELTDPKAVSSELNKSLNKAFSDYGVNPNSPEAEASKNAAKEVIAKAKDPEALLGKLQSGEVRPAGAAPDTLKGADALKAADTAAGSGDATKAAASGVKKAASELLQKYVGQEAPDGVIKNVAPNGSWIEYTSPTGRTFRETFPLEMNGKTYNSAAPYLKAMFGAPKESVSRVSKQLSEGQVYLIFNRVCSLNESLLVEGVLEEGPLDALKGFAAKGLQKAQSVGKNLTTKVTADKLNKAWQKAGSPTDSEELASFLTAQGVNSGVVDNVYQSLKIAKTPAKTQKSKQAKPTGTSDNSASQPTVAGSAVSYAEVKAQIMKLDKKGRQRLAAYLSKQLGTA